MEENKTRQCDRGDTAISERPEMCPSAAHELLERLRWLFEAHARRPKVSPFIGDPTLPFKSENIITLLAV